jgi:hypothetical protein
MVEADIKRSPTQGMRGTPYFPERSDKSPLMGLGLGTRITTGGYPPLSQPQMAQQNHVGQSMTDRRSPPYDLKNSAANANHKKKLSKKYESLISAFSVESVSDDA